MPVEVLSATEYYKLVASTVEGCSTDPEGTAEAYCLGTLTASEAQGFENHYIACSRCAGIVENADTYVSSIQQAARRVRAKMARVKSANQS